MKEAFLSYSRRNKAWADCIVDEIRSRDFDVLYDDDVKGSTDWWKTIVTQVSQSEWFLLLLSKDSWASETVQKEICLALGRVTNEEDKVLQEEVPNKRDKKNILIIRIDNADISQDEIGKALLKLQQIDADNIDIDNCEAVGRRAKSAMRIQQRRVLTRRALVSAYVHDIRRNPVIGTAFHELLSKASLLPALERSFLLDIDNMMRSTLVSMG